MRESEREEGVGSPFSCAWGEVASEGGTEEPHGVALLLVVGHELLKLFQFGSKID